VRRHLRKLLIVGVVAALVGVGATIGSASSGKAKKSLAGGTYRVGWESSFNFTDGFDPTGEYLGDALGIQSNLLLRGLVGFNHVAGAPGNKVVADLATSIPKPTNGGKTYTFKLKSGIKFGPPVNREITSKDVAWALNRMAVPKNGAQYAFYFDGTIVGWHEVATGKAKTISGIKTPNAKTISITLTRPTGDWLLRMALPAAFPIPPEVGKCFEGKPGQYGRNVISSGPYMIEGSDKADASSCDKLKPFSGFDGQTKLVLVRNPAYSARTDSKAARENLPDRFEFLVNANPDDIANRIKAGDLEDNDVA
jgi:peptide/nickel transport system substrate-binding protein